MTFFWQQPSCLAIHTERLDDDRVWSRVVLFADHLHARGLTAVWFSINPTAEAYRREEYDEKKWITRLRYLHDHSQRVEQHTHFYGGVKGTYDFSAEHMVRRLIEDRAWLERNGYPIRGFVSGAWIMNKTLMAILGNQKYAYDCSARAFPLPYLAGRGNELILHEIRNFGPVREIPTTHALKDFWQQRNMPYTLVYMHDYDLLRLPFRVLARAFLVGRGQLYNPMELS